MYFLRLFVPSRRGGFCLAFSAVAAGALLAGCGTYRFKTALRPDGKYDLEKLVADLEEIKPAPLREITMIPFIHARTTGFSRRSSGSSLFPLEERSAWEPTMNAFSSTRFPAGFHLAEGVSWGPLWLSWSARDSYYDASKAVYEVVEATSILWRLWFHARTQVKTPYGIREEKRYGLLLGILPLHHSIRYRQAGEAAALEAPAQ